MEGQLPVKNYTATLSVEEDEDSPHRSEVHWDARFDAKGASDEDAQKRIAEILEAGVSGIKKKAIAADVAKEPALPTGSDVKD